MRIFATKLKELRAEKNMSMDSLAKHIKVTKATISRWENGLADIKSDELIVVANFFGVSTDYLLGLEED